MYSKNKHLIVWLSKHHAINRRGGTAPLILNLGIRYRGLVSFRPLHPRWRSCRWPLKRKQGDPHNQYQRLETRRVSCSFWTSNSVSSVIQPIQSPVAIQTKLLRLHTKNLTNK